MFSHSRLFHVIAGGVIGALLVTACQPASAPPAGGSILRVGISDYPHSFNPNLNRSAPGFSLYFAMMDTLTQADASKGGVLSPRLATSWTLMDSTTWQFKLRQGVKWHDGSPFSADDVAATIDLALNGQPKAQYSSRVEGVTKVEVVDPNTVNMHLASPNALLPQNLVDIYIYQAKEIKQGGNDAVNANPIGTGMFKFASKQEGVSVTLTKNPDYWGSPAKFDQLVFKVYPEEATRVAAFQNGEVDIAMDLSPDDATVIKAKGLGVASTAVGQSAVVGLKTTRSGSPLANKQVRQALNYATNKDTIIKGVLQGYVTPLEAQLVGSDGVGYDSTLKAYPYDPAKAKQMLAAAGYPNGFTITFETSDGPNVKMKEVSEAVAGQLQSVGVNAKVDQLEWGKYISNFGDFDMYFLAWNYFPVMDADLVYQWFTCDNQYKQMCDPAFDQLFQQERAQPDPQKRVEILKKMAGIMRDNAPVIFLYQNPNIFGVGKRVTGFTPTPDNLIHFAPISVTGGI